MVRHWISHGVTIFRVDNPHTKPLPFWERLLAEIAGTDPDVIFLAEAFTRPAMMHALAKIGFHQSYTYFTWRNSAAELTEYLTELSGPAAAYMRPNFFVNTPDILVRLPAARQPRRLPGPRGARGDAVAVLGRLRRLRAMRERPAAAGQRGVPGLREVPVPAAGLGARRARGPEHRALSSPSSTRSGERIPPWRSFVTCASIFRTGRRFCASLRRWPRCRAVPSEMALTQTRFSSS